MEIRSSIIPLTGYPALEKRVGDARADDPLVSPPVAPEQPALAIRALADAREAESLLIRNGQRQLFLDPITDQRSRRAINAYATLDQTDQKDYLSTVLGIDVYV